MAKSIRSKCKRKARAEFRRTIGEEFHKKSMKKVQEKLKDCVEKQSLKSLDKLENIFGSAQEEPLPESMDTTTVGIDAVEGGLIPASKELKGENKAPISRKARRSGKHSLKSATTKKKRQAEDQPKQRPRYFVQF